MLTLDSVKFLTAFIVRGQNVVGACICYWFTLLRLHLLPSFAIGRLHSYLELTDYQYSYCLLGVALPR